MSVLQCECPYVGEVTPERMRDYDEQLEQPFVNHEPGQCRCTNDIRLYRREDARLWLCSICTMFGDENIKN